MIYLYSCPTVSRLYSLFDRWLRADLLKNVKSFISLLWKVDNANPLVKAKKQVRGREIYYNPVDITSKERQNINTNLISNFEG